MFTVFSRQQAEPEKPLPQTAKDVGLMTGQITYFGPNSILTNLYGVTQDQKVASVGMCGE